MKNPLLSKTIQGILLVVLPHFLAKVGLKFDDAAVQGWSEDILMVIGGVWGIYGRCRAEVPLKNPLASNKLLPVVLAAAVITGAGCESLTPNQQAVLKAVAKAAVVFGLNQLGDSVKEVRPFQPALLGVINATFAATDNAASLGDALTEGIKTVVADQALRAQVIDALKRQLRGATASGPALDRQARFNAALAERL